MSLLGALSDAHGNVGAFDVAIAVLRARGAQDFLFLGDAVGYIPSADVVHRLVAMGPRVRCIRGNHEAYLLSGNVGDARDRVYQLARTKQLLSAADLRYIESWPASLELRSGKFALQLVHGSPSDPTHGYVYPDTDLSGFDSEADFVFMGNSHHPFVRRSGSCSYVNVGSCGLPRDHGALGAAALFDDQDGSVEVLRFDIEAAHVKVLRDISGIDDSVREVMLRRKDVFYGTRV